MGWSGGGIGSEGVQAGPAASCSPSLSPTDTHFVVGSQCAAHGSHAGALFVLPRLSHHTCRSAATRVSRCCLPELVAPPAALSPLGDQPLTKRMPIAPANSSAIGRLSHHHHPRISRPAERSSTPSKRRTSFAPAFQKDARRALTGGCHYHIANQKFHSKSKKAFPLFATAPLLQSTHICPRGRQGTLSARPASHTNHDRGHA